jgi:deazaflavin-dependent oxidoreductase (nitroreductase family)
MNDDEPRPEHQRNEAYVEPPREQIPAISRAHVSAMESTDADAVWTAAGMHHLVLRTIGRRSGAEHKVALPYWLDTGGGRVVVASFAGADEHPAWFLNLSDREVNPEVLVRAQHGSYWSVAEIVEDEEYARIWAELVADRPFYDDYRRRTARTLPLVRLPVTRPA